MEQLEIPFEVLEPEGVEETISSEPAEAVRRNALAKASSVVMGLHEGLVVGADTVVVRDGRAFGKPESPREAEETLKALRGSEHEVLTGIAVVDAASGKEETDLVETKVIMASISDAEVKAYVASGEPLGKAGGYAIQGRGAALVEGVEGCYHNVVGLPLFRLVRLLKGFGYDYLAS